MSIFITTIIFFSLVIGFLFASIELVNRSYKNLVVVDEDSLDENSEELDQRSMIFDLINEVENLKKQILELFFYMRSVISPIFARHFYFLLFIPYLTGET